MRLKSGANTSAISRVEIKQPNYGAENDGRLRELLTNSETNCGAAFLYTFEKMEGPDSDEREAMINEAAAEAPVAMDEGEAPEMTAEQEEALVGIYRETERHGLTIDDLLMYFEYMQEFQDADEPIPGTTRAHPQWYPDAFSPAAIEHEQEHEQERYEERRRTRKRN